MPIVLHRHQIARVELLAAVRNRLVDGAVVHQRIAVFEQPRLALAENDVSLDACAHVHNAGMRDADELLHPSYRFAHAWRKYLAEHAT